jgi:hypothetical protein
MRKRILAATLLSSLMAVLLQAAPLPDTARSVEKENPPDI